MVLILRHHGGRILIIIMSNDDRTFIEWLGFEESAKIFKINWLGTLLGFVLMFMFLLFIAMSVIGVSLLFITLVGVGPYASDATGAAIRNIGLVVAALIGAPFLVWRSIVAQKNAFTAEQSQITDRINNAVIGLGSEKIVKQIIETPRFKNEENDDRSQDASGALVSALRPDGQPLIDREQYEFTEPNIEVRVGAILALERTSRDSSRDQTHIFDLLCTYIRENSDKAAQETGADPRSTPREDIQAAVRVIAKQEKFEGSIAEFHKSQRILPDLRRSKLNGVYARSGTFDFALLDGSSWVNADLMNCRFRGANAREGCDFSGALLERANFNDASLHDVKFSRDTSLGEASFRGSSLANLDFSSQDCGPIDFEDATISDCSFYSSLLASSSFRNSYINSCNFGFSTLFEVDFSGARNWEQEQFDAAYGVCAGEGKTILPEGAVYPEHWLDLSDLGKEYQAWETFLHEYCGWYRGQTGVSSEWA